VRADFRTVAATNKDLMAEVRAGRFREDLYYRLNVFHISVPPLRERREDIPILARSFVERLARSMNRPIPRIEDEAMKVLADYDWPGNVRELANAVERAMVVRNEDAIRREDLPIVVAAEGQPSRPSPRSLSEVERSHVAAILEETGWNISEAARLLGVDRSTVYNKIKQYGLAKD
jgi:DNA-binding NtrC family response regulator